MLIYKTVTSLLLLFMFSCLSCKNHVEYKSPAGYDLSKPQKFLLNDALHEISGITFLNGNSDSIFAIEDEDGKLFTYTFSNKQISKSKFGKKGDFEDVTILDNKTFVVLRSDGSLFLFPVAAISNAKIDDVRIYEHFLPEGEYEGLTAADGKLYALCKNCMADNEKKEVSVFTIDHPGGDSLSIASSFKIDISMLKAKETGKVKFHPSCIAKNPLTKDWYIISSVNKMLLVLDGQWKVKEFIPIDPSLFNQPEGLTFNQKGDMYISNEGGDGTADILLFRYQAQ